MKTACQISSLFLLASLTAAAAGNDFEGAWEIENMSCDGQAVEGSTSVHQMAFVIKGQKMDLVYTGSTNMLISSGPLEAIAGSNEIHYTGKGALATNWELLIDRPSSTSLHIREAKPDAAPYKKASEGPLGLEAAVTPCPNSGQKLDLLLKKIPDFSY